MVPRAGVTIRDVARRAGVSITAVSHALNDKGTISESTRERVRQAAAELDYQADAFARGMRQGRIGVIGLVMRSLDALGDYTPDGVDVFVRFAGILSAKALGRGWSLTLLPDLTRRPVPSMAFAMDGYVVMSPLEGDPVTELLDARGIAYVTYGREPTRVGFDSWAAEDDRDAAHQLLRHLEAAGAQEVALVRGTDRNAWNLDYTEVYLRWCAERARAPRLYEQPEGSGVPGERRWPIASSPTDCPMRCCASPAGTPRVCSGICRTADSWCRGTSWWRRGPTPSTPGRVARRSPRSR